MTRLTGLNGTIVSRSHTASPAPSKMPPTNSRPDSSQLGSSGASAQPARTSPAQTAAALSRSAFAAFNAPSASCWIGSPQSTNGSAWSVPPLLQ